MSASEGINMEGPRLLRPVGPALATYFRPGHRDHTTLLDLIGEAPETLAGIVFDPCLEPRQRELREEAREAGLETVLDPRALELSTEVGFDRTAIQQLPWANGAHDTAASLRGDVAETFVDAVAVYTVEKGFSAVLAPTHYLSADEDDWLDIDLDLTRRLRRRLDSLAASDTPIYYPLAIHASRLRDAAERRRLVHLLRGMPIDALWLRVHPFGSNSGQVAMRRYIDACKDFHQLGIPLVAEHSGAAGVALLAFGAVGGIESGITYGEHYNISALFRAPRDGAPFSPQARVYLPDLGAFLSRKQAEAFFETRQMKGSFGCRDTSCCRRGTVDTLRDPRPHFVRQRLREVARVSRAPETLRSQVYLEDFLRPATDLALRAAKVEPALETARKRLEGWRSVLGAMAHDGPITSFASAPEGRRIQTRQSA
jgi:hypothetical protein